MHEKVCEIVRKSLEEINQTLTNKINFDAKGQIVLYGKGGVLDSIALVSLIVTVEQYLEEELGVSVILANEQAMSQKNSPFASFHTLVNYIESLIE